MISTPPDPLALRLLSAVAAPHLHAAPSDTPPAPELLAALADTFGPAPAGPPPSDAALARAALALAAEDPVVARHLEAMVEQGPPPVMGIGTTALAVTAALAVLQTEVLFERTSTGKWRVKLLKRAASDGLLKALAQLLMRALSRPPVDLGEGKPRLPK